MAGRTSRVQAGVRCGGAALLALLAPYAGAQDPLWIARHSSGDLSAPDARAIAVAAGPAQTVYVLAWASNGSDNDFLTYKYDAAGTLLWVQAYDSGGADTATALAVDPAGRAFVTGYGGGGARTVAYEADGTFAWSAFQAQASARAVALGPGGSVCVAGGKNAGTFPDFWVTCYDAAGSEQWSATWGQPSPDQAENVARLAVDAAGNAYVTGYRVAPHDAVTVRFDAGGALGWVAAYDGGAYDEGVGIGVAGDAVYVAARAGNSPYDFAVLRYDAATGAEQWRRRYDAGDNDEPSALALDPAGNVLVTGKSYAPGGYDFLTLEYAPDGTLQWFARYDDTWGLPSSVAADAAGNVYVAGATHNGLYSDYRLVKYGPGGSQLWTASYDSGGDDWALALAVGSDQVAVAGFAGERAYTAAFSSAGASLWGHVEPAMSTGDDRFGSSDVRRAKRCLALGPGGRVHVTGTSSNGTTAVFKTLVYEPDGTEAWSAAFDAGPQGKAYGLAVGTTGDTYVVGTGVGGLRLVKYDPAGGLSWSASAPATQGYALALDAAGNAYVSGPLATGIGVFKFSAGGTLVWSASYDAPGSYDTPVALALDPSGNVYVTGYAVASSTDQFVAGFDPGGSPRWSAVHDSGSYWDDVPAALAADAAGNLLVTGKTSYTQEFLQGPGRTPADIYLSDFLTLKYQSDGTPAWLRRADFSTVDEAYDLALGAGGDVYVTGTALGGFQTVKYSAEGTQQWATAGASTGVAYALALGADGRTHAAGFGSSSTDDFVVVTYDPNGTPQHQARYDAGQSDVAYALALSDTGVAYAAGVSKLYGPDFLTVAFDLQPPVAPSFFGSTTHAATGWGGAALGLQFWGASDPPVSSGLAGYSLAFDQSASSVPDDTLELPHTADPHAAVSPPLSEGVGYYAHLRVCDQARNCSAAVHAGPFGVDLTAPFPPGALSSPSHTPGVPSDDTTIDLTWTPAIDALSGLGGYRYGFDSNPDPACDFVLALPSSATSLSGPPLAAGTWYAHVCARDRAGNVSPVASLGPFVVNAVADVEVTLSAAPDPAAAHGPLTYALKATNVGPSLAPSVSVVFTPADGLELLSTAPGPPTCVPAAGRVYCLLGDLPAGTTVELAFVVRAATLGTFVSSARVALGRGAVDLSPDNDVAQAATEVRVFKGDLDHDASIDLLLRHDPSGEHWLWRMQGTSRLEALALVPGTTDAGWSVSGVDDFDGDLRDDLVLQNPELGSVAFWRMDGIQRLGPPAPLGNAPPLAPNWRLVASADFDHDGGPDLLWRNLVSQKLVVWKLVGMSRQAALVPQPDQAPDANWQIVGARDFDRDGNTDILWWNRVSGRVVQWLLDANLVRIQGRFTVPAGAGDANWQVVATGDYGLGPGGEPGSHDLVWRNAASGRLVVWHLDAAGVRTAAVFVQPQAPPEPATAWTVVGPR